MIILEGKTTEELVKAFRDIFNRLDPSIQSKEYMRLERIIKNKPVIVAEPLDDYTRRFKFQSVEHLTSWLQKNGYPRANKANIHRVLRGERDAAYGYKIYYMKEK